MKSVAELSPSYRRGGAASTRCRLHPANQVLQVAGKPSPGREEKRDLENVYRLHKPEQRLPKGAVRPPADRPDNRFNRGLGVAMFPRRLLWVQPDQNGCRR